MAALTPAHREALDLAVDFLSRDLAVLARTPVDAAWERSEERRRAEALHPKPRGWTSGPDDFELRIGNWIAYAEPLWERDLDHIPWALDRGDRFHAFDRLYHALLEFVQALFIARRVYPIAYDKWIEQQFRDLLGLPDLASRLAAALDINHVREGAATVEALLNEYVRPESPSPAA